MKISSTATRAYEFACHAASCAPPPAGTGGSKGGGNASNPKYQQMKAREKYQKQLAHTNKFRAAQGMAPLTH